MRTAYRKAHLLPLLLLSLYSVSVCLADNCRFGEHVTNTGVQAIATAKEQPTGQNWKPIRIVTSAKELQGLSKYCENDGTTHERGPQGAVSECRDIFAIINAEKSKIVMDVLEKAIALHTDRLLVQRATGALLIPDFSSHMRCRLFNVPPDHHTTGVNNADMVLYVAAARDTGEYGAPSFGVTCAKSASGRFIAGAFAFGSGNIEISRTTVRLIAHHIAHALGFSYSEIKSRNMIMDKKMRCKNNSVAMMKSDITNEMTRAHYGCSKAEGMELEDGKDNNKKLSDWERRNEKGELMAKPIGDPDTPFMGFSSNITLAAFEDIGFYKANSLVYCLPHRGAKVQYTCYGEAKNSTPHPG